VLLWGLTGLALSALALVVVLFERYDGLVSELRTDLNQLNDTSGDYVRKSKLEKCRAVLKQCSREKYAWSTARKQIERELNASKQERTELKSELRRMHERLTHLDGNGQVEP
jgi:uncharacterized protein (DUF3084 family)